MNQELFSKVDDYISNLFGTNTEILESARKLIEQEGIPQISVSPNQGKMLFILAKLCGVNKILEIGTLGGYSTIWMASALPKNGKLITLELEPKHAEVAQKNIDHSGLHDKVEIKIGKALESLKQINDKFDMIFIDADKPPYMKYFEEALRLSHPGTLIIADNVVRDGKVIEPNKEDEEIVGISRFNDMLAKCKDVEAIIVPTVGEKGYDGMAISVVK